MPTTKQQMYAIIGNAIKRFYNRHGVYEYSSCEVTITTNINGVYPITLKGKFTPSMTIYLPKIQEIVDGADFQIVDVTSSDHRGDMINKINSANANGMLVGELKQVAERLYPVHIVIKIKRIGEKVSSHTISVGVVE